MPRHARLDAPGVLHHIIVRGIERRLIFRDSIDKDRFVERMEKVFIDTHTPCYAWALLGNHAHLLVKTGKVPLHTVMARLLTGHAVTFNKRHHRHGQLFQNRYKSILCQEDAYLTELVCYIHLNPLRVKIVKALSELARYPYSGHAALMGKASHPWQETDDVLRHFGTAKTALQRYLSSLEERLGRGKRSELTGGGLLRSYGSWTEVKRTARLERIKGDERILGDTSFVEGILSRAQEPLSRPAAPRMALDELAKRVGALAGIDPRRLAEKSRRAHLVEARGLFCYFAVRELGYAATTVASYLGLTQPGVGYAVERGAVMARERAYVLGELG